MTNEDFWHLFPIMLVPYNPKQETFCLEEEKALLKSWKRYCEKNKSYGMTFVEGLMAKPIIDILPEIILNPGDRWFILSALKSMGYISEGDIHKILSIDCL